MSMISVMEKIAIRLIQSNPFYSSLLSQCRKIEVTGELAKQIPTEAVSIENGRINFYYNPEFLETLTLDEAVGVLTHEMNHLCLGHCIRLKDEFKENPAIANIACVLPNTFLLGPNKRISEVKKGEVVFSEAGKLVKIQQVMNRSFKGNLIQIKASSMLPFSVTPEHPLLIRRRKYKKSRHPIELLEKQWINASELTNNDYLLVPKVLGTMDLTQLNLEPFVNSDPLLRNHIVGPLKNLKLELTEELAWILGFYVADGSNNLKGGIGLNFSLHSKEMHYARKIQKYFRQFEYTSRLIKDPSNKKSPFKAQLGMKVMVNSSILGRAFQEWCGHGAYNKQIPDFILFHKNINLVKAFLRGYFDGDGSYYIDKVSHVKRAIASTISQGLAYQCQLAIQRLGNDNWSMLHKLDHNNGIGKQQQYTIIWHKAKKQYRTLNGKRVKVRMQLWKEFDTYYAVPVKKIEQVPYQGLVYNLQTEDHTFCVSNIITHNCDLNANRHIPKLPKGACTVESISKELNIKLNADDTSENYYKEILKNSPKMEVKDNGDGTFTITMKDKNGKVTGQITVKPVDCHDKWNKDGEADIPELAKEVIRQAVKEAAEATQRQQGTLPAGMEQVIQDWLKPPVVSWKTLLKRFIAASIKSGHKMSWKRPNRRFGEQQKGKLSDRTIALTVAIDTSGSIGEEDFQAFLSEMKSIQSCYKGTITVIECDAEIQKEYKLQKYNRADNKFKGRGGTSFKPVFEYLKEKKIKTDALIFFTDGYGDQDSCKKPNFPVIWTVTTSGQKFPFGYVISLLDNPDGKKKK